MNKNIILCGLFMMISAIVSYPDNRMSGELSVETSLKTYEKSRSSANAQALGNVLGGVTLTSIAYVCGHLCGVKTPWTRVALPLGVVLGESIYLYSLYINKLPQVDKDLQKSKNDSGEDVLKHNSKWNLSSLVMDQARNTQKIRLGVACAVGLVTFVGCRNYADNWGTLLTQASSVASATLLLEQALGAVVKIDPTTTFEEQLKEVVKYFHKQ